MKNESEDEVKMCLTQDHKEQDWELPSGQLHGNPSMNAVLNSDPAILVNTYTPYHYSFSIILTITVTQRECCT